jgi:hypothetical protein
MAGVQLRILLTENSYNIANNTSTCTAVVQLASQGKSWSNYQCNGNLWFNGSKYSFTSTFSKSTSWQTLYTLANVVVPHWDDGTKTLAASASFATGVSVGTLTASASLNLTTLYRKSELSIVNASVSFGDEIQFRITSKNPAFTHKVWIGKTGSLDWRVILDNVKEGVHTWTIPEEYARFVTGTDTSFQLYMTTYYNGTDIGSTDYGNILNVATISSMAPVVSINYEAENPALYAKFRNNFIRGVSKLYINLLPTFSYGAAFINGTITIDNQIYNLQNETTAITTEAITSMHPVITAVVTDSRGMTTTTSVTLDNVLDYKAPEIVSGKVWRTNTETGTEEIAGGDYIHAKIAVRVDNVLGKNTPKYYMRVTHAGGTNNVELKPEHISAQADVTTIERTIPQPIQGFAKIILIIEDRFNTYTMDVHSATSVDKTVVIDTVKKGVGVGVPVENSGVASKDFHVYNKVYGHNKMYKRALVVSTGDTISGNVYGAVTLVLDKDTVQFSIPVSVLINGSGLKIKRINAYLRSLTGETIALTPDENATDITTFCSVYLNSSAPITLAITKANAFKKYVDTFQPITAFITYELEVE